MRSDRSAPLLYVAPVAPAPKVRRQWSGREKALAVVVVMVLLGVLLHRGSRALEHAVVQVAGRAEGQVRLVLQSDPMASYRPPQAVGPEQPSPSAAAALPGTLNYASVEHRYNVPAAHAIAAIKATVRAARSAGWRFNGHIANYDPTPGVPAPAGAIAKRATATGAPSGQVPSTLTITIDDQPGSTAPRSKDRTVTLDIYLQSTVLAVPRTVPAGG